MENIKEILDFFLHLDDALRGLTETYGVWMYAIVFGIIFCETGLIVMPFLPGDSLLFVLGALAAAKALDIYLLWGLLTVAAILGDSFNYFVGTKMADALKQSDQKIIKPEYLKKTHDFYEKHGPKAIVLARFLPILRTIVPFLAGAGQMDYKKFLFYNVAGAVIWVTVGLWAGWFFGNLPWVEKNFSLVILVIIVVSLIPAVLEFLKHKKDKSSCR